MYDGGYDSRNPFPHDGEGGRSCTGYGCDCDEKNYGYHSGGSGGSGDNNSGCGIWIAIIIALVIGYAINELLGVIIMIGAIIYMIFL